jgi:hypothetical protein
MFVNFVKEYQFLISRARRSAALLFSVHTPIPATARPAGRPRGLRV